MEKNIWHHSPVGEKHGRLTIISAFPGARGSWNVDCDCECGWQWHGKLSALSSGNTQSCGCLRKERHRASVVKHGLSGHKIYQIWKRMCQRCNNKNDPNYHRYGGRGITLCERWNVFENFAADMLPTWENGLSIERINNNAGYNPENCKWATRIEQGRNTRACKFIEYNGERKCLAEWEQIYGLTCGLLHHRLNKGWSMERSLNTPRMKSGCDPNNPIFASGDDNKCKKH